MQSPDMQRIRHILEYCEEIEKTINRYGDDFAIFDADPDYQRSVSFSILQIGELCNGLSDDYRSSTAAQMEWQAIRRMRNLFAHNYGNMSRIIIWDTAQNSIPELKAFCESELQAAGQ